MITQKSADILAQSGGMKLLLAKDLGGYEAHPNDFFEWVINVADNQPSAGWIAGVVGVHPWEISIMDPILQSEIYGDSAETLVASPYAPMGRAKPVEGGFIFSGRWPFSTGTDLCDWIILGGMVVGEDGRPSSPPDVRHFVLPRSDYQIVPDSWNVSGLRGTGSKDVEIHDAFVPSHRVVEARWMYDGTYGRQRRPGSPLYQMLFGLMFPAAIASGTLGIARGAVRSFTEQMEGRVSVSGVVARFDPIQIDALARASADVEASIAHLKTMTSELYDHVAGGGEITAAQRLRFRRDQVRASTRSITAVDELFRFSGSSAIADGCVLDRYRRDMHAAATHICNVVQPVYQNWGIEWFTGELPVGPF